MPEAWFRFSGMFLLKIVWTIAEGKALLGLAGAGTGGQEYQGHHSLSLEQAQDHSGDREVNDQARSVHDGCYQGRTRRRRIELCPGEDKG